MSKPKQAEEITGLLAAIVASSDDAIISKTLDGIITSWNQGAERIFGYTPEEAIGQHISLIIPHERHHEESNIIDRLRHGGRVEHFETVRRRKDGSLLDVSLTISPVKDASGRVIGASKVARDVTAQKRVERELRESEQRFRVITDASPMLVWMSGTDKLCYYFNKGWLNFVGRSIEQEIGNGWTENVHPEDFDRCLQLYVTSFEARQPFEMEYRMRHHTGQYRWILDRGVPRFAPDGTFEGYVGGCLDIHDQKEAAEQTRKADDMARLMRAQDEERRRIARELHDSAGQTLAVLAMNLPQLVQSVEGIAPELAEKGREIEAMIRQLQNEIRTTSYLLHPPLLDEIGLASALNCYVGGLAERSQVAITLDVAANVGRLPSDMELAIFRLVQECLTNIYRHSDSKTALIRIGLEGEKIRIQVKDHGKGISPERMLEIQSHGSGVGIMGIRERIRQFHGEMKLESNGSGTSVIVTIPIPKEHASIDGAPFQGASAPNSSLLSPRPR
jgi:PAS domain S-box-containing protein